MTKILNLIRSINTKELNQKNAELLSDIVKSITKCGIYNNEESESSILTDKSTEVSLAFEDFNNTIDNSSLLLYEKYDFGDILIWNIQIHKYSQFPKVQIYSEKISHLKILLQNIMIIIILFLEWIKIA